MERNACTLWICFKRYKSAMAKAVSKMDGMFFHVHWNLSILTVCLDVLQSWVTSSSIPTLTTARNSRMPVFAVRTIINTFWSKKDSVNKDGAPQKLESFCKMANLGKQNSYFTS